MTLSTDNIYSVSAGVGVGMNLGSKGHFTHETESP